MATQPKEGNPGLHLLEDTRGTLRKLLHGTQDALGAIGDAIKRRPYRSALIAFEITAGGAEAGYIATHRDAFDFMSNRPAVADTLTPTQQANQDKTNNEFVAPLVLPTATETAVPKVTPTAVATAKPEASPTPVEKPKELNAKNLNSYVEIMPDNKFDALAAQNPNAITLPVYSNSPDFEAQNVKSSYKGPEINGDGGYIEVKGSNILLSAPFGGHLQITYLDSKNPDQPTNINFGNGKVGVSITTYKNFEPSAKVSLATNNLTEGSLNNKKTLSGELKRDQLIAKVDGYMTIAFFTIEDVEPYEYKNPDGSMRIIRQITTYVTPELFAEAIGAGYDWLKTADGKLAKRQISQ